MVVPPDREARSGFPEAVISDLDGTLIDSTRAMTHAIRHGCATVGIELDSRADLNWCVGPRIEDSLRKLVGSARIPAAREAFRAEYRRSAPVLTYCMPGVPTCINEMRLAGVRLAVCTYKPKPLAEMILRALGLHSLFEVVVGRGLHDDERTKAVLLEEALATLAVDVADAAYVGDHDEDENAAKQVGIVFFRFGQLQWDEISSILLG